MYEPMLGMHATMTNEQNNIEPEKADCSEVDPVEIRRRTKMAIEALVKGESHSSIELNLQHIWVAAGGKSGVPGSDNYMAELYPDDG